MAADQLSKLNPDGTLLGQSITDKLGFYGLATPIVQPSGAAQGTVASLTSTFVSLVAGVNALRDALVALSLLKGS